MKTEACKKILIIRRKALGDSLLTISSITQLSEFFVGAEIDIIIDHQFVDIIKSTINDVKIFSYPDQTSNWPKFIRSQNYDIVIDYLGSARTSFWTLFSGAPIRIGYDFRIRKWAYNYRINNNTLSDPSRNSASSTVALRNYHTGPLLSCPEYKNIYQTVNN